MTSKIPFYHAGLLTASMELPDLSNHPEEFDKVYVVSDFDPKCLNVQGTAIGQRYYFALRFKDRECLDAVMFALKFPKIIGQLMKDIEMADMEPVAPELLGVEEAPEVSGFDRG